MDELLTISYDYGNGKMMIRCNFFPAPQNKLRKLLKVVMLDYDKSEQLLEIMYHYVIHEIHDNTDEYLAVYYGKNGKKKLEANAEEIWKVLKTYDRRN